MKQFGVTETYEPAFVPDWEQKLLDQNIIITKRLSDDMIDKLIANKDKIILHHTVTGQGGTEYEPGVRRWNDEFYAFEQLIEKGFPLDHYVLRMDPLIPFSKNTILRIMDVISAWHEWCQKNDKIIRVRISMIDMYNHVKKRFNGAGIQYPDCRFHLPDECFKFVSDLFMNCNRFLIETCAEADRFRHIATKVGCVSELDLKILGVKYEPHDLESAYQRPGCLCLAKKQILGVKPGRCTHKCIYCYWKDEV